MCSNGFWVKYSPIISGISNIATSIAAAAAAVALWVAYSQLALTHEQLKKAALSLRSSTAIQISQEGRNIARIFKSDRKNNIGFVFSFIHTAWYQHHIGALDNALWIPIDAEVCAFLQGESSQTFFTDNRKKQFHADFVAYMERKVEKCVSQ